MSCEFTKDRVTVTSRKDQENNMQTNLKMRKRSREDSDVAGSPRTKIQGRSNINHSSNNMPDPSNNMKEGVSVRKRSAGGDGEIPRKRIRCSNLNNPTKHSEGPVEDRSIELGKRKASGDAGPPIKKTRCSTNNTKTAEPSVISTEDHLVEPKKREASDVEAPEKKKRCSINSSLELNVGSDDDGGDVSQNLNQNATTEEERIFEMSSPQNISRADFMEKYRQLYPLGEGGYGSVYAGFRKWDQLPVAIKHIPSKKVSCTKVTCNGKVFKIVLEVALMLKATGLQGSVGQSAAVSLLDWYITENELVLVMEKPPRSMDLINYLQFRGGSLNEREAKMILKQLVDAAIDMHSKGVFHRDIKLQNVLIQLDSDVPRVRIIDFGCGTFSTDFSYDSFCGTQAFFPPEWFDSKVYWACATTVWQLGALFHILLTGELFTTMGFINHQHRISCSLSRGVRFLLYLCLIREPFFRVTLEDLEHYIL